MIRTDWEDRIAGAGLSVGGASAGAPAQADPLVYMGKRKEGQFRYDWSGGSTRKPTPGQGGVFGPPSGAAGAPGPAAFPLGVQSKPQKVPDVRTLPEAEAEWDEWEDEERQQWADHLIEAGVIPEEDRYDYATLQKWWYTMVDESSRKFTNAGKEVDPWQMATIWGGGDGSGATASSLGRDVMGEGPVQRYTQSSRNRSVDLTDPSTAKALVNQVLGRALGRNASDEEIREFTNVLNKAERRNPVISTSTTDFELRDDGSGYDTKTRTKTRGGVDAGQVLMDEAADSRESKAYQASTVYWNALEQAIGTVGGN